MIAPIAIMACVAWIVFLLTMFERAVRSFLGTPSTLIFPWVLASEDMVVALILVASIGISRINKTKDKAEELCLRNYFTWGRSPRNKMEGGSKEHISQFSFSANKSLACTLNPPCAVSLPSSEVAMLWGANTAVFPLFERWRVRASERDGRMERDLLTAHICTHTDTPINMRQQVSAGGSYEKSIFVRGVHERTR